jgi:hypothetical protein
VLFVPALMVLESCLTHCFSVNCKTPADHFVATLIFPALKKSKFSHRGGISYILRQRFRKPGLENLAAVLLDSCGTFFVLIAVNIYSLLN